MQAVEFFNLKSPFEKIKSLEAVCNQALLTTEIFKIDLSPGRSCEVRPIKELAAKIGIGSAMGQARLLHDLANIELQATELAVRTLFEFADAPAALREQLVSIALDEGRHLRLCLDLIQHLGFAWGDWPVHMGLWQAVSSQDSLLERLIIVHCYLEGSGLDSGEALLGRLSGVDAKAVRQVVRTIVDEEVAHVEFGTRWYREICRLSAQDSDAEFAKIISGLAVKVPRREKIANARRQRAGFTAQEIFALEKARAAPGSP